MTGIWPDFGLIQSDFDCIGRNLAGLARFRPDLVGIRRWLLDFGNDRLEREGRMRRLKESRLRVPSRKNDLRF
jgi:hypothetical protein